MLPSPRLRLHLLALVLALLPLGLGAQGLSPILLAPDAARQGDPLLVWALSPGSLGGTELRLQSTTGAILLRSPVFAAPDSLVAEVLPQAAPGAGGSSQLPPAPPPAQAPALHLFGYLLALPTSLKPGSYRLLLAPLSPPPAAASPGAAGTASTPTGAAPTGAAAASPGAGTASTPTGAAPATAASGAVAPASTGAAPASALPPERVFTLTARDFPFEKIPLDQANTDLLTVPDPRKTAEAERLDAVLAAVDPGAALIDGSPFLRPVQSYRKTAGFGDRRRYVYTDGGSSLSVHEGEDLAVPSGSAVLACARGRVVLCADRAVTGLSVVVEHLPGLYSIYFHLSSIQVSEGQLVEEGQKLGSSGSTGLSTGPHLHWELRAMGQAVDPEYWVGSPLLDTKRIKATITALFEGR